MLAVTSSCQGSEKNLKAMRPRDENVGRCPPPRCALSAGNLVARVMLIPNHGGFLKLHRRTPRGCAFVGGRKIRDSEEEPNGSSDHLTHSLPFQALLSLTFFERHISLIPPGFPLSRKTCPTLQGDQLAALLGGNVSFRDQSAPKVRTTNTWNGITLWSVNVYLPPGPRRVLVEHFLPFAYRNTFPSTLPFSVRCLSTKSRNVLENPGTRVSTFCSHDSRA